MSWKYFKLMLLVVGMLAVSAQAGVNWDVTNGNFDANVPNLDGWWNWMPNPAVESVSGTNAPVVHDGYYLRVTSNNPVAGESVKVGNNAGLDTGTSYNVSLMYRDDNRGVAGLEIVYVDAAWNQVGDLYYEGAWPEHLTWQFVDITPRDTAQGNGLWTQWTSPTYVMPAYAEIIYVNLNVWRTGWDGDWGPADVSFDDVTVIPEPATIVMLGLGGLALIRRKRA